MDIYIIYIGDLSESIIPLIYDFKLIRNGQWTICYNKIDEKNVFLTEIVEAGVENIIFKKGVDYDELSKSDVGVLLKEDYCDLYESNNLFIVDDFKMLINPTLYVVSELVKPEYVKRTNSLFSSMFIALNPLTNKHIIDNACRNNRLFFDENRLKSFIIKFNIKNIIVAGCENFLVFFNHFKKTFPDIIFTYEVRDFLHPLNKYNIYSRRERELDCSQKCDKIIFSSKEISDYFLNSLNTGNIDNTIVFNGIDTDKMPPVRMKTSKFTIGAFYNDNDIAAEEVELLVDVCESLVRDGETICLRIIGRNNSNLNLKKKFISHSSRVSDLESEYANIDVYCIPCLNEDYKLLIPEVRPFKAFFYKIPVLLSTCPSLKNISNNGKRCMLFKKGNMRDLHNKILKIMYEGYNPRLLNAGHHFIIKERDVKCQREKIHKLLFDNLKNTNRNTIRFCFIVSSYNSSKFIHKNLDSIRSQSYDNYRILYVNDCSTDDTKQVLETYRFDYEYERLQIHHNDERLWPARCRYNAYMKCKDDEILIFLDGDDWLITHKCLSILYSKYINKNLFATFGSMNGEPFQYSHWKPFSRTKTKPYFPHLRTVRAKVVKAVPEFYLKDEKGEWLHMCTDVALFMSAVELIGKLYIFLPNKLVHYNRYHDKHSKEGYNFRNEKMEKRRRHNHRIIKNMEPLHQIFYKV
jgi:glycosyltransferase involved in cell wall biosynthesis